MKIWRIVEATGVLGILTVLPAAANAQLDDRTVVSIVRECRKIADPAARVQCYDNIPLGTAPSAQPGSVNAPPAASPPLASQPRGFGGNQLPRPPAEQARQAAEERLSTTLSAVAELSPGIYLMTLDDGAQWQFSEAVSSTYDPPRRGSTIEIAAGALGGYLMTYEGQRSVRVRRVR